MRQKTYLTPEQQLDRTLGYALDNFPCKHEHVFMGMMVRNTRFLRAGDFIVFHFDNGGGEHWRSYAVSSKGFRVKNGYVLFNTSYPNCRKLSLRGRHKSFTAENTTVTKDAIILGRRDQPITFSQIVLEWSVDPTVQRAIVAALRAESVECR